MTVSGPMVKMNSGGGPGSGAGVGAQMPERPDLIEPATGAKVTQDSLAETTTRANAQPDSATSVTAQSGSSAGPMPFGASSAKSSGASEGAPVVEESGRLVDVRGRGSDDETVKSALAPAKEGTV